MITIPFQPSSNEILSNDSGTTPQGTITNSDDSFDSFNSHFVSSEESNEVKAQDSSNLNKPSSGREYITSFTTTTTSTIRPDIVKGVEIIRNLVEQAKTTTEAPVGAVQSLTTMRSMKNLKSYNFDSSINSAESTSRASTTPMRIPPNHKLSPLDTTPPLIKSTTTTTLRARVRTIKPLDPIEDSFELEEPISTTRQPVKQTTSTTTTTTSTTMRTTTRGSNRNLPKPQTTLPLDINDIEELLNRIPSTTARIKTTMTTKRPRTTTQAPQDDLLFLRQLVRETAYFISSVRVIDETLLFSLQQRLLQRPTSTRKPVQMKSTTRAPPVTKTTNLPSSSSFDDLLESFQQEPSTTRRPKLTTFSDVDDIAFLKGLVRFILFSLLTSRKTKLNF